MTLAAPDVRANVHARHTPWPTPLETARMSHEAGSGERIAVTNRSLVRDGEPWVPVSGEFHYSRVPRSAWEERLRLMKSGGLNVVSCYVIWLHHETVRGHYRFDGDNDLRAFVDTCVEVGLDVVLRIGPWAHGEARNGGFPDWVQSQPVAHRTNDPAYLALVREWYGRIATELEGRFGPGGRIIAVQLDNELYDQPDHLSTLKVIAQEVGIAAPLWTATAWGGAQLPQGEVFPLYGGYGDGFWAETSAPWDPSFREHYFFSHVWDDPGIGADVRALAGSSEGDDVAVVANAEFPPATCELGGGMARAYHRRPTIGGLDVAAVALCKIGNGSAWQGYYMYAGGRNPAPHLQESHATSYPNDMPLFDYDFNAPISATGRINPAHSHLRRQHSFLDAFGARLAQMTSSLPSDRPTGVEDVHTLRWALRSDGSGGFVFVNRHQPYVSLGDSALTTFHVELSDRAITFPHAPVRLPDGLLAIFPVGLDIGGVHLEWATATPLTMLGAGGEDVIVLCAHEGLLPQVSFATGVSVENAAREVHLEGSVVTFPSDVTSAVRVCSATGESVTVVMLSADAAARAWVLGTETERRLIVSDDPVWLDGDGRLVGWSDSAAARVWEVGKRGAESVRTVTERACERREVRCSTIRTAAAVPAEYGSFQGRASAPTAEDRDRLAARLRLELEGHEVANGEIEVEWSGDVIGLLIDGVRVADQFWAGESFVVDLAAVNPHGRASVELEILPAHPDAAISVPGVGAPSSEARVHRARWVRRGRWHEEAPA